HRDRDNVAVPDVPAPDEQRPAVRGPGKSLHKGLFFAPRTMRVGGSPLPARTTYTPSPGPELNRSNARWLPSGAQVGLVQSASAIATARRSDGASRSANQISNVPFTLAMTTAMRRPSRVSVGLCSYG